MRVLVVKTSSMGDVIHTLPALTDASRALNGVVFDWVVEENFAEIPGWHAAVDRVIPVAIRRWRRNVFRAVGGPEWRDFRFALARHPYDYVIDAQGLLKSAWIARLAPGPAFGMDRSTVRESLAALFYDCRFAIDRRLHAVDRLRELFACSLCYPRPDTPADYGLHAANFGIASEDEPTLVFVHGTTCADKHWPEPYWRQLCELAAARGYRVRLPWGDELSQQRAKRLAEASTAVEVLPKLNLTALAGVFVQAEAVVAVDTGLGHLAAALGVPCISLYAATKPDRIGTIGIAGQAHLVASRFEPPEPPASVEPEAFAALTPQRVWDALSGILTFYP